MTDWKQEAKDFVLAYGYMAAYNLMPEEEGKKPDLRHGLTEKSYAEYTRSAGRAFPPFHLADESDCYEAAYAGGWIPLLAGAAPTGCSYYLMDLSCRVPPRVVANWLKMLVGEIPDEEVTEKTWKRINNKLAPVEIIEALSGLCRRRLKTHLDWEMKKHWWINRNTQAVERAKKMVIAAMVAERPQSVLKKL